MKTSLTVLGVILGLLVAVTLVVMAVFGRDIPLQDDSDLRIVRIEIPAEDNAFTYFNSASNTFYFPDDVKSNVCDMIEGKKWDEQLADDVLKKNEQTLGYVEKGLLCSSCQVPEVTGWDTRLSYLVPWRNIGRVMALRTLWLFRKGEQKEAFDKAVLTIQFGQVVQEHAGCAINFYIGWAIKEMGFRAMRLMVPDSTLSAEKLQGYVHELSTFTPSERGFANAWKVEYSVVKKTIDEFQTGDFDWTAIGLTEEKKPSKKKISKYFLQPNRTKHTFAQVYRTLIADSSKNYSDMDSIRIVQEIETRGSPSFDKSPSFFPWQISPNRVGGTLYRLLLPSMDGALRKLCENRLSLSVTQLFLLLKIYKQEEGDLPDSLLDLVPEYIKEIPGDPYDGKPLRYSKSKKNLYSVGQDLEDSGGSQKNDSPSDWSESRRRWKAEDLVFEIEF